MLIRNARDCAGKPIEVWLRDGKIAAVGLGLLVPEGEELLDAKGRTILQPSSTHTAIGAPPALSIRRIFPPALPQPLPAGIPL